MSTTRQLKRIESVNLSPIYSHFDESIQGAATIRAYNKQDHFMMESLARVDKHQQAYYPVIISNRYKSCLRINIFNHLRFVYLLEVSVSALL